MNKYFSPAQPALKAVVCAAFVSVGCVLGPANAQESAPAADSAVVDPAEALRTAQQLMIDGDLAYEARDFETAWAKFKGAVDALPAGVGPREALMERYVAGAVSFSRDLVKKGDVARAQSVVSLAMAPEYAGEHTLLVQELAQIMDPIRTNPALTAEHSRKVIEVAQGLRRAQGAHEIADFDLAEKYYHQVLRIDRYNTAARQGLEKAHLARSRYAQAAYDETRADMLSAVDAGWESRNGIDVVDEALLQTGDAAFAPTSGAQILVQEIILPRIAIYDQTIEDTIQILRRLAAEADGRTLPDAELGINIVSSISVEDSLKSFTLEARNMPVAKVLDLIAKRIGGTWTANQFLVQLNSSGDEGQGFDTRSWKVPADFLSRGELQSGDRDGDLFGNETGEFVTKKLSAREYLENAGIAFPEGSQVGFSAGSRILTVTNTRRNLDAVDGLVQALLDTEPVNLIFTMKLLTVSEQVLDELGYDWLVQPAGRGDVFLGGGSVGNTGDARNFSSGTVRPVTSGLRSGDSAISPNSIDSLIEAGTTGFLATNQPAPSPLQLNVFDRQAFSVALRGLNQKTGVDLSSIPAVTTVPDQAALIESVREFIYPTEYEPPELPNAVANFSSIFITAGPGGINIDQTSSQPITPVTPATPTSFDVRRVGTTMQVEGTVSEDRQFVDVKLNGGISDFDGFLNYGSPITGASSQDIFSPPTPGNPFGNLIGTTGVTDVITDNAILMPVFSATTVDTAVTLRTGSTVAIGGLRTEEVATVRDGVPILSDLPLLGRFFKSEATQRTRNHVIIFLTAEVVDPSGQPLAAQY